MALSLGPQKIAMNPSADSRTGAILDVAALVVVNALAHALLRRLDFGVGVSAFGIVPTLMLATWLLRRRGVHWRDLGFRRPDSLGKAALWALGLFVVDMLALPMIVDPVSGALGLEPQQLRAFSDLRGNTFLYLVMLIPVTTELEGTKTASAGAASLSGGAGGVE